MTEPDRSQTATTSPPPSRLSLVEYTRIATVHAHAAALLRTCISPWGLAASGDRGGYHNLWARDAMITALGALATEDSELHDAVERSLHSLAAHQESRGCIPNKIDFTDPPRVNFRAYGDGSLWFVLIAARFARRFPDRDTSDLLSAADRALEFTRYQDQDGGGLVTIQEGASWMDLFPLRGKTTYINTLRYYATSELAETRSSHGEVAAFDTLANEAAHIRAMVNEKLWYEPGKDRARIIQDSFSTSSYDAAGYDALGRKLLLPEKRILREDAYFLPYQTLRHFGEWFDSFGNLLAIESGLASTEQQTAILDFMERHSLAAPYPVRAIHPAQYPGDPDWREYFHFGDLNLPDQYHNGGCWPLLGGFYVRALTRTGRTDAAATALAQLAAANAAPGADGFAFSEYLHGATGTPSGMADQAWSAGMFLAACEAFFETSPV